MAEIAGLKLIVPSSVAATGSATASIGANGKVTVTDMNNTDTVTINGCFSATYDNYLVVLVGTTSAASTAGSSFAHQLTASGVPVTTGYTRQRLEADGSSVVGARTTNGILLRQGGSNPSGAHIYFYGPFLAQPTAIRSVSASSFKDANIQDNAVTQSTSSAYDGFKISGGDASTQDLTLQIYGLSQ